MFRDANQVENGIAKQALSFTKGYHVFESAPDCISSALRVDLAHILSHKSLYWFSLIWTYIQLF